MSEDSGSEQAHQKKAISSGARWIAMAVFSALLVIALSIMVFREGGPSGALDGQALQGRIQTLLLSQPKGFDFVLNDNPIVVPAEISREWFGGLEGSDLVLRVQGIYDAHYHVEPTWDWTLGDDGALVLRVPSPELVKTTLRPGSLILETKPGSVSSVDESGLRQVALSSLSVYLEREEETLVRDRREALRTRIIDFVTKSLGFTGEINLVFPDETERGDL